MAVLHPSIFKNQSVFLGDNHHKDFWEYNYKVLREFNPDYLLLEVIGKHRFYTKKERQEAKRSGIYLDDENVMGYNSDAFTLADDLDVPMIGIDTWTKPYEWPESWGDPDDESFQETSDFYREKRMVQVAKGFLPKGKVLLIVGAHHLRDTSPLYTLGKERAIVKLFKLDSEG